MTAIEITMLLILAVTGGYVSGTDIRRSIIPNRALLLAGVPGMLLDIIYYSRFYPEGVMPFLRNLAVMVIFSVALYALHIWAAGDSKFMILICLLIPVRLTVLDTGAFSEFMIFVFAISLAFFFLLFDGIYEVAVKKRTISRENILKGFRRYLVGYVINILYVFLFLKLEMLFSLHVRFLDSRVIMILNIALMLLLSGIKILRKWYLVVSVLAVSVAISLRTGIWLLRPSSVLYYIVIAVFMLFELFISEFNYDWIPTETVQPGMVLSRLSCMMMAASKVKNLPQSTTEDLRSRLNREQADAVIRWGKTAKGMKKIQIVRKIPFAIFIFLGTICYLVIALHLGGRL